jgi:HlyD family secretion protein
MKRLLILLIIVVIVGGGLALARQSARNAATETQAASVLDQTTAQRGSLLLTVSATGAVTPDRQVPLLFAGSGVVREVLVRAGDSVYEGDVLARLDTSDLELALSDAQVRLQMQQIAYDALTGPASEADLAAAQAAVNAAGAALNAAYSSGNPNAAEIADLRSELARNQLWQAQLQRDMANAASSGGGGFSPDISGLIPDGVDVSQETIDRINQGLAGVIPSFSLPSGGGVPESSLTQAEYGVQIADANASAAENRGADPGSVASANAALVSAQQQLNRLKDGASEFDLQAAEINLSMAQLAVEQAQAALDSALLVAPFDGVIAQNNLVEGEVPPNTVAAMLLIDEGALYVDLAIDETDVTKVIVGQTVNFNFDALPDAEITGHITRIGVTPTVTGQLVTYPVRVTLDPTEEPVRIGMSATATITTDELDDVLTVPNRFIRIERTTQQAYVTVQGDNGRFTEIPVELGLRNELTSQITSGLEPGQIIVLLPRSSFDPFGG